MRCLIRTLTRKGKGGVAHEDRSWEGSVLSIGRATDQAIFLSDLRVALNHAVIRELPGGKFRIESLIGAGVRINGSLEQSAIVSPGDQIDIGGQRLTIAKKPKGYDFGVLVTVPEVKKTESATALTKSATHLSSTWLNKRKASWILFSVILVVGLLIPVGAYFVAPLKDLTRNSPVPGDSQWEAGTLQAAHHYFGEDCNACHTKAFQMVKDQACLECHGATPAHTEPEFFDLPALTEARCATCHKDHNGLDGLVRTDESLCSDCHRDLNALTSGSTQLSDAADFDRLHPQFRIELAAWDDDGQYAPQVVSLSDSNLVENSNLKFPHDIHLDAAGLDTPSGTRVLECADCHQSEAGGALMKPVHFESMCQDCHRLGFDPFAPERQVPHGKVAEVLFMLDEFYANRALQGGYEDFTAPAVVRQRRRPGQSLNRQQQMEALSWARLKARKVGEDLFQGQACGTCHTVESDTNEAGEASWHIDPVRVAGQWYLSAKFTHGSHTTFSCLSCHDALRSDTSEDVLIPGIENCRSCHGGAHTENRVASSCVSCHEFHIDDKLKMAEATADR